MCVYANAEEERPPAPIYHYITQTFHPTTQPPTHEQPQLVDQSLFNVGTTRPREVLLIGFDAKQPSRYLANVKEKLPEQAQLEWAPGAFVWRVWLKWIVGVD